eukprot:263804_1
MHMHLIQLKHLVHVLHQLFLKNNQIILSPVHSNTHTHASPTYLQDRGVPFGNIFIMNNMGCFLWKNTYPPMKPLKLLKTSYIKTLAIQLYKIDSDQFQFPLESKYRWE